MHDGHLVSLAQHVLIAGDEQAADVHQAVLLGGHGGSLGVGEHFAGDLADALILVAFLTLVDEVGVLGQTGGVDDQGDVVGLADLGDLADVGHGHGLTTVVVAGDGDDGAAHLAGMLSDEVAHALGIDVALEGMVVGVGGGAFLDAEVKGLAAHDFGVAAEGVEVHVADGVHAGTGIDLRHDVVGSAALMGGLHVGHAEHFLHGLLQTVEGLAAGVGLVTLEHGAPLVLGHGGGAGVGDAVHVAIFSAQTEGVVAGFLQGLLAIFLGGLLNGLDNLDAERFGGHVFHCQNTLPFYYVFLRRDTRVPIS